MSMTRDEAEAIYNAGKEAVITKLMELDAKVEALTKKVEELTDLVARLMKNSSNSSKPPSSDIVKPPKVTNRAERRRLEKIRRKKGGQLGHPKWTRAAFPPEQIDNLITYHLDKCPECGSSLVRAHDEVDRIQQQVAFRTPSVEKIEHRSHAYWCRKCQSIHYARIPDESVRQGFFKPDIAACVCFLKFVGNMSLSGIKQYILDTNGIKVTKGYLAKVIRKGSQSLDVAYDELLRAMPNQLVVNADETSHKENGKLCWTWVFRANLCALFKISESRGSDVLIDVLGREFNGVLGCDYFSAYRKFMGDFDVKVQFCLAHLIRDVKFLVDHINPVVKNYGTRILTALRELFHTIHAREKMTPARFAARLEECKRAVLKAGTASVPSRSLTENMAKRLRKHGASYFTFITTPEIDPTNNCAEQAIRFVVLHRRVSQGTRSEQGRIACERFFTVVATCALQGRSAYEFIKESLVNYFRDLPGPSLLPQPNGTG
jgi:transposase